MRTQKRFVLLLFTLLFIAACQPGDELSLDQAGLLVYNQVIMASPNKDALMLYPWPEKLDAGDKVFSAFGTEIAFKVESPSWFFWIDDEPGARFEHKNRLVLVDARTSNVRIAESGFWPFVNQYSMWDGNTQKTTVPPITGNIVLSHSARAAIPTIKITGLDIAGTGPSLAQDCPCTNPKKYALVISGEDEPSNGFTADATNMANQLASDGYEVTTLLPMTGSTPLSAVTGQDIAGVGGSKANPSTPANIKAQIAILAGKARSCDEILIYISTHGTRTNCDRLKALFSGNHPNGVSVDLMSGIAEGTRDIGGVAESKIDGQLCLKADPPLRVKYAPTGLTARDIAGLGESLTGIRLPAANERVVGNPDGGFIGMDDINAALEGMYSGNVNIILDSCYSGAATDALAGDGRTVITSTDAYSTAGGSSDGGLFTNALLEGLKKGQGLKEATAGATPGLEAGTSGLVQHPQYSQGKQKTPCPDVLPKPTTDCFENWVCDPWSAQEFGPCINGVMTGTKSRGCVEKNHCGTSAFQPPLTETTTQPCVTDIITGCTPAWNCGAWSSWSTCANGQETRMKTCTDTNGCQSTTGKPATTESRACGDNIPSCTESWTCGAWSSWSTCESSTQSRTRTCTDSSACGTSYDRPDTSESQSCGPSYHEKEAFLDAIAGGSTSIGTGTKTFSLSAGQSAVYVFNVDPSKTYEQAVTASTGVAISTQQRYGPPQLTYTDTAPGTFTFSGGPVMEAGDQQQVSITIGPADSATTGQITMSEE
ncbi:thrombospondin type-1 domain-containing protein [Candidatus Woesearchaeota archaeon]|nr:thrombospondin type-1 domain-containing protein [Candidatus Woesearchaeota archaeon]